MPPQPVEQAFPQDADDHVDVTYSRRDCARCGATMHQRREPAHPE